jgi:hypothetical protein
MRRLHTAREVIEALGGRAKVMELTEATKNAVWNWEGYFDAFPADCFKLMNDRLAQKNMTAPAYLWRQRGFERPKRAA